MIDGVAVVDKPSGMTSHDVVRRCRKLFAQKKIGHAGTLDPDATGVLVVGLGRATRLLQFMSGLPKSYAAQIVLGAATTTLDAGGDVVERWDMSSVTLEQVRQVAAEFVGTIRQIPPMVSAVQIGGRRLYQLARAGIEVERPARLVTVTRFEVDDLRLTGPLDDGQRLVDACIDCSSGTYIRVLAADVGRALGGGAHVGTLRRTSVGPWAERDAVALADLDETRVIPPADSLPWLPAVTVSEDAATRIGHGQALDCADVGASGEGPWRMIGPSGRLLAVYVRADETTMKASVVVASP